MKSNQESQPFWNDLDRFGDRIAFISSDGDSVSYLELEQRVSLLAEKIESEGPSLGVLFIDNDIRSFITLLATIRAGSKAILIPKKINRDSRETILQKYRPNWLYESNQIDEPVKKQELQWIQRSAKEEDSLSKNLAILLSTSGSTGSPKTVRLSKSNIASNANSIADYLQIRSTDRAITLLPPTYSYGLSVITSHLSVGATIVVANVSVVTHDFLDILRKREVTSISGVPYTYQMLKRTGFERNMPDSLRAMTQAGGRLDDGLIRHYDLIARERGIEFYVMYGQTEATARISYVPPHMLSGKIGSIGIPIPGGKMNVMPESGEIIYSGPNVAMGYATAREDLARGDDFGGVLRTGDVGYRDEDDYFFITGRLSRFIKLSGNRIGLDEIEQHLQARLGLPVSAAGRDDKLVALIETSERATIKLALELLSASFAIHHSLCRIECVERLPMFDNGKKDYKPLEELS